MARPRDRTVVIIEWARLPTFLVLFAMRLGNTTLVLTEQRSCSLGEYRREDGSQEDSSER